MFIGCLVPVYMYVHTYIGTLTISFLHLPECPFDFSADFVQWFYISCSIHCTSTCTVRLLLYMSIGSSYKATKIERNMGGQSQPK